MTFRATYRLQLGTDLDLHSARELLGYLDDLGISHVYLSPVWQARAGSTHGYDVIDPAAISRELGGEDALRALSAEARERGMGLILDVVPNHMAADDTNGYFHGCDSLPASRRLMVLAAWMPDCSATSATPGSPSKFITSPTANTSGCPG